MRPLIHTILTSLSAGALALLVLCGCEMNNGAFLDRLTERIVQEHAELAGQSGTPVQLRRIAVDDLGAFTLDLDAEDGTCGFVVSGVAYVGKIDLDWMVNASCKGRGQERIPAYLVPRHRGSNCNSEPNDVKRLECRGSELVLVRV